MRYRIITILLSTLFNSHAFAQTITGNLSLFANQEIKLEGFNGFKTYLISNTKIDEKGNFTLNYSTSDYGVGYLTSADDKPLFVILCGEDVELAGEALSNTGTIRVEKGKENQWFEQYAKEQPRREQALSAWLYLERIYALDTLFNVQKTTSKAIEQEKQRIKDEDAAFIAKLPRDSYIRWFLPARKLVSSVSVVAQYRTAEIPATIAAFRAMDYTDLRLYKSGLFRDAIESHFWLLENSGRAPDSVFIEMKISIDGMLEKLIRDNKKLNEVTDCLFGLLEKHSLFQASEYLALKVLNELNCAIDSDLANQLESYRAMKTGNIAPDFTLGGLSYLNGLQQKQFHNLSDLKTPYTLVLFGASWCPKCMEDLPEIVKVYQKWKTQGVQVVFVSLDENKESYQSFIKDFPFISLCDFQKWNSKVVKDYYVFATPAMYLLDANRKILLRPNSVKQMDAWVDWYLVQGNIN